MLSSGNGEKSILCYSEHQDRASIIESMPPRKRRQRQGRRKAGRRRSKRSSPKTNKIRVIAGRVSLKVSGYRQNQHVSASKLVRYIPVSKLRLAAKKVLRTTSVPTKQRKRRRRRTKTRTV